MCVCCKAVIAAKDETIAVLSLDREEAWRQLDILLDKKDAVLAKYAAREKRLRELADEWDGGIWAPYMNHAARLLAILNEGEK